MIKMNRLYIQAYMFSVKIFGINHESYLKIHHSVLKLSAITCLNEKIISTLFRNDHIVFCILTRTGDLFSFQNTFYFENICRLQKNSTCEVQLRQTLIPSNI